MIRIENVSKSFVLHNQGAAEIPVMQGASLRVAAGECVALVGASGAGKSTLMRMLYGNYLTASGQMIVGDLDVVPRVSTLDVVAEPLLMTGTSMDDAHAQAEILLARLNIPQRLWPLSPTTFSGGEQQRVNIARGFAYPYPALLLDEPTASLDPTNRATVLDMIAEAKARGAAIIGIFHDAAARDAICDRQLDVTQFTPGLAA
jgi:alpha-D-ribose 1-methylphosphonate 5-triphosphate synthase subunit PhnL